MTGHVHTIRPHRKVRSGCHQCKTRRIKCDEQKPRCSQCTRHSRNCTYPTPSTASSISSQSTSTEASAKAPHESPRDSKNSTTELNLGDLELLQNWTLSSCEGFGSKPGDEVFWRRDVPQMALKHPFLMRALLAVSALHLGRQRPEQKPAFLAIAALHQNLALPSYRYIVADLGHRMNQENAAAMLAFGNLTTAHAFAAPQPPGSILFAGFCSSTGIPEWIRILRGGHRIREMIRGWHVEGHVPRVLPEHIDLSLNSNEPHLSQLEQHINSLDITTAEDIEENSVCNEALKLLRQCFAIPHQPNPPYGYKFVTFLWVEMVSDRYLELLEDLRPVALVLLGYLCVLLKRCENYWYIKGAGERILEQISNILGSEWQVWLEWPTMEVLVP